MKFLNTALLAATASAASFQQDTQKVLGNTDASSQWTDLEKAWGKMTAEGKAIMDEVSMFVPDMASQLPVKVAPKKHTRKPDSHWDHIVKGSELKSVWSEDAQTLADKAENDWVDAYNMRVKAVDPSVLKVDSVKQLSGYLDDEANDKHLFFWFFESRNDPKNDPVVLWLNGGPGCSSLMGLFFELGPSSIGGKGKPIFNDFSWNSNASVIFLDQPVNVGYSYSGSDVSSTVAASKDINALLSLFFHNFPQYAKQDFHIAGESYAGHYIPVFAEEILSHPKSNINLKSVLIGNGLTDPYTQYDYYRPMGCGDGGYPAVLSESECQSMDNALPRCKSLIESCYNSGSAWSCVPASIYCNNNMIGPYQRTGQNVYDVRKKCEGDSLCYPGLNVITDFLNEQSVKDAVGAEVDKYDSCNFDINRNFLFNGDWMQPFHLKVPELLKKIPVLIYAGDADFICNWLGNQAWAEALEWSGKAKYNAAKLVPLTGASSRGADAESKKDEYGMVKSAGNFTFMQIFKAGHMVPYDQPEGSLNFFNRWLSGEWLA